PRETNDLPSTSSEPAVAFGIGFAVELGRVVPTAVELDEQAGGWVGDVDPTDPGFAIAGVELSDRVGQARVPGEITEPGFELARRRNVAVGTIGQEQAK